MGGRFERVIELFATTLTDAVGIDARLSLPLASTYTSL